MTAAGRPQREGLSIGAVLAQLRPEFPDVTISKIRFLESEGLVRPARTPSGYRQFGPADVERLRFVLSAQRDHYLPLKVIKEQLDAADRGDGTSAVLRSPRTLVAVESAAEDGPTRDCPNLPNSPSIPRPRLGSRRTTCSVSRGSTRPCCTSCTSTAS